MSSKGTIPLGSGSFTPSTESKNVESCVQTQDCSHIGSKHSIYDTSLNKLGANEELGEDVRNLGLYLRGCKVVQHWAGDYAPPFFPTLYSASLPSLIILDLSVDTTSI